MVYTYPNFENLTARFLNSAAEHNVMRPASLLAYVLLIRGAAPLAPVPTVEAKALLQQAQALRAEAAVMEGELREMQRLSGKNNILPVVVDENPSWRTQLWLGDEAEGPVMRTAWKLLEGGRATLDVLSGGTKSESISTRDEHAPGWRFVGPSRQGIECWFWVAHAASKTTTKYVLETSATCEAMCHTLQRFETETEATFKACEARVQEIEAKREAGGFHPKLVWDHAVALDELKVAAEIHAEYRASAERTQGAAIDLGGSDGVYTLGERGTLTATKGDGPGSSQKGTFAAWKSKH